MKSFVNFLISRFALIASILAFVPSTSVAASEPAEVSDSAGSDFVPTRLEIDLSALELPKWDQERVLGSFQKEIGGVIYKGHGVPKAEGNADAIVVVKMSWTDSSGELNYAIKMTVVRDGQPDSVAEFECIGCDDSDVGRAVESHMAEIVQHLKMAVKATNDGPPEVDPPEVKPDPVVVGLKDDTERRPLGTLGKAGIPIALVGLGAFGGGLAMAVIGAPPDGARGELTEGLDLRPPGIVLAIGGGVAAVVGVALFIADRAKKKKGTTRVAPVLDRGLVGLSLKARF